MVFARREPADAATVHHILWSLAITSTETVFHDVQGFPRAQGGVNLVLTAKHYLEQANDPLFVIDDQGCGLVVHIVYISGWIVLLTATTAAGSNHASMVVVNYDAAGGPSGEAELAIFRPGVAGDRKRRGGTRTVPAGTLGSIQQSVYRCRVSGRRLHPFNWIIWLFEEVCPFWSSERARVGRRKLINSTEARTRLGLAMDEFVSSAATC